MSKNRQHKQLIKRQNESEESEFEDEEDEEEESEDNGDYERDDFVVGDDEKDDSVVEEDENAGDSEDDENDELDDDDLEIIKGKKKTKLRKNGKVVKEENDEDEFGVAEVDDNYDENQESARIERHKKKKKIDRHRDNLIGIEGELIHEEREELTRAEKIKRLNQIYAKEELEDEYITEKDNLIKILDFPERKLRVLTENELFEIYEKIKADSKSNPLASTAIEISQEVEFIYEKLKMTTAGFSDMSNRIKEKIKNVLNYMKIDHYETPFIAMYRTMYFQPELSSSDVWKIHDLDIEWKRLCQQKDLVKKAFHQIRGLGIDNLEDVERGIDTVRTIHDLKYIDQFISFNRRLYTEELNNMIVNNDINYIKIKDELDLENQAIENQAHKRPLRKPEMPREKRDKMIEITRQFSLTPLQFSYNLELIRTQQYDVHKIIVPNDPEEIPRVFVMQFDSSSSSIMNSVNTIIQFLANELASFPPVRSTIFNYLKSYGYVSVTPTEQGLTELDVYHPSFKVKRLKNKPLSSFNNDLFIEIIKAEKSKLITYVIDFPENEKRSLNEKLLKCYVHPRVQCELTKNWNVIRESIITHLLEQTILDFKKEIIDILIENAENYVISQAATNFYSLLMTGPYKKEQIGKCLYFEESARTMSMVYDSEKDLVYTVILDEFGEIKEVHTFTYLLNRLDFQNSGGNKFDSMFGNNNTTLNSNTSFETINRNMNNIEEEKQKFKEIVEKYLPELVVIGANQIKTKILKENVSQLMSEFSKVERYWITYGDLSVPYIFATSSYADLKYTQFSNFYRQAISLARFKQNPMAEILQLWHEETNSNRCLSLNLHPLQKHINQAKLMNALEHEAIRAVNLVGVDINRVKDHFHLRKQLGFIAGLGPRKSIHLIEKANAIEELNSRIAIKMIFGEIVTTNCSGFIKIKQYLVYSNLVMSQNKLAKTEISSGLSNTSNLLDLTRIHPEVYHFAKKLASDIVSERISENAKLEKVMLNPDLLKDIDSEEYIRKIEDLGNYKFSLIHYFIMNELSAPFQDPRRNHRDIAEYELFKVITSDSPINIGDLVLCKSQKVGKNHVFVTLDNGLEGTLWKTDIFDNPVEDEIAKMNEMYPRNSLFYARVKGINKTTFKIDLTTRPSKLATHKDVVRVNELDEFFEIDESTDFKNTHFVQESVVDRKKYSNRNINHPNFKNFNYSECIRYLKDRPIGDYIFRPSSISSSHLTLTWKFYNDIYSNVTIKEEARPQGASIGSKLIISSEVYSSLAEIVDRYIKPCEKITKESINNRKFFPSKSIEDLEEKLKSDKMKDPMIIHYLFTINSAFPQFIILAYIPKPNYVTKEYIKVKPNGLFFHNEYMFDLNEVAKYFKENFSKDSYKSYVRKIKPPNEESSYDIQSVSNIDASFSTIKNDYYNTSSVGSVAGVSLLGNKRDKSPRRDRGDRDNRSRHHSGKNL